MLDIIAAGVTVHHEISRLSVTGAQCEPAVICKVEDLLSGERQMHRAVPRYVWMSRNECVQQFSQKHAQVGC